MPANLRDNLQNAKEKMSDGLQSARESLKENLQTAKENLQATRSEVLAARKCENINDPVDSYFVDYIAMAFSRLFIKLHIIPNAVTIMSMISGVAGGVLIALNRSFLLDLAGAALIFLSVVFDASDGQVARLTRHFSKIGRMLDGLSDASVYFTLYLACVVRLWNRSLLTNVTVWHVLLIFFGLITFLLYVVQCQLPDYFKNLHMYMIDNSHGNELSRAKHVKAELEQAKKGSFDRFSLSCYYIYTSAQERRAPETQKLLDAIEIHGKNDKLCDAFYAKSRSLVKLTNLLTFHPRTIVLIPCIFLHWELIGMLFVVRILEPIRWILLRSYEQLSHRLIRMVR